MRTVGDTKVTEKPTCTVSCEWTYCDFSSANNPGASQSTGAGGEGAAGGGAGEELVVAE